MSLLKDEVELLRRVPLFAGIETSRLKLLAFTSDIVTFKAGQVLFNQGDMGDSAYVIVAGRVRVYASTPKGMLEIAEVGESGFVGEIAILCDVPRTASVAAVTDVKALRIRKEALSELLLNFPSIGVSMLREVAMRLTRTTADLIAAQSRLAT